MGFTIRDYLLRPWRIKQEPLVIRVLQVATYVTLIVAGVAALADPPTLTGNGNSATIAMGVALVGGGILAAVSLPWGQWWLERGATLILAGGVVAYGVALRHFDVGIGETVMRGAISLVVLLGLAIRLVHITGLWLDPSKPIKPKRER